MVTGRPAMGSAMTASRSDVSAAAVTENRDDVFPYPHQTLYDRMVDRYLLPDDRVEVVHKCPPGDSGEMPCCGRTPFEVPQYHRMTIDADEVTCGGT